MKKHIAIILTIIFMFASLPVFAESDELEYTPYINGYQDGTFRPDEYVSVAEAISMVANLSTESEIIGAAGALTKYCKCCNPIPGDPIIGFLDENNEVVIHKKVCQRAISIASHQGGKIVNAKWTKHTILSFLARISLKGIDRIGIVNEITKYITLVLSVNIRKIHFETHDGIFEGYIDLYVHNTEDLEVIMKRMLKIKGVESVLRTDIKE